MESWQMILLIAFVFLFIAIYFLAKYKGPFQIGLLFGGIHLIIVLALSVLIFFRLNSDGEAVMAFIPLLIFDFPMSFLIEPSNKLADMLIGHNFMVSNFFVPASIFVILGSVQYFIGGYLLGLIIKKIQNIFKK